MHVSEGLMQLAERRDRTPGFPSQEDLVRPTFTRGLRNKPATPPAGHLEATLGLLPVATDATHLAEGLSAACAAVGLLLRVHGAVALQVAGGDEAFPAQRAAVAALPRVDEQVDPQVVGLSEALPAVGAAERPLAGVHAPVQLERRRAGEHAAAHPAHHGFFGHAPQGTDGRGRGGGGGGRARGGGSGGG